MGPTKYDDIVARHAGQVGLSTWSHSNTKQGSKVLKLPKYRDQPNIKIQCTVSLVAWTSRIALDCVLFLILN